MTKLAWGASGTREFEAGADRGVLYVGTNPGVAWNGLISVGEKPNGGEPTPYYLDGIKYLNVAATEEYEATIQAYSAPYEFNACDGTGELANGLMITQQPRKSFDFSYRTLIGNDLLSTDYGYRIHLVYNALSKPPSRDNQTLEKTTSANTLSWDISTTPDWAQGYKPSSHFIIDTRRTDRIVIDEIESILYGNNVNDPRMPTVVELIDIFNTYATINIMVLLDDGTTAVVDLPILINTVAPTPAEGNTTVWLDTSAVEYSVLKQVIGD